MPDPRGQAQHLPRGFLTATTAHWFSPYRLYLGNPMDPPDLLSVELSTSRPTQHLGRVKSKPPNSLATSRALAALGY